MKYGESIFDILYLLFAIVSGMLILQKATNNTGRTMGFATLVLGCGDAFHLVPRVLNYFVEGDFQAALGIGKLVTSITMTVFYVLLYFIWLGWYREKENKSMTTAVWALAAVRAALCLFPQNGWLQNSSDPLWGIIRNVPFVILGGVICWLYFQKRGEEGTFRFFWVYILLSFLFYIPVAVAAGLVPMLGMLMLPKTICYILMVCVFLKAVRRGRSKA